MGVSWLNKLVGVGALAVASLFSASKAESCTSAVSMGRGATNVAVAEDASAAYWNPAGLVQISRPELDMTFSPSSYYRNFIAYAQPINENHVVGINLFYKKSYAEKGYIKLAYGRKFNEKLSIGGNIGVEMVYSTDVYGNGSVDEKCLADLGLLYKHNDRFKLGLLLQSLQKESVNLRPGVSFKLTDKNLLVLEGYDLLDNYTFVDRSTLEQKPYRHFRCGLERRINDVWSIRGGLKIGDPEGREFEGTTFTGSAGISFRRKDLETSLATAKGGYILTLNVKF